MSTGYVAVQWSRHKRIYDSIVAAAIVVYIGLFFLVTWLVTDAERLPSGPVLLMRATGSCAFILLHLILCIGPAARFMPRLLPVLYNRRHLGVMTFLVALVHGLVVVGFYHGFGDVNPLVSLLGINANFNSLAGFPFQLLGVAALVLLFLLAATSHDFWLKTLTPMWWKRLHMCVYLAYALLVAHVMLGSVQAESNRVAVIAVGIGMLVVVSLHLAAGVREVRADAGSVSAGGSWIDVGPIESIDESRAKTVCAPGGERIAVFKHQGRVSAISNVCAHQGGPLGEGQVIDGCVTCPWHGWQYRAEDGCSPPPFKEKVATYEVRIVRGRVEVNSNAREQAADVALVQEGHHGKS